MNAVNIFSLFIWLFCTTKSFGQVQDMGSCDFKFNECDYHPGSPDEAQFNWLLSDDDDYMEVKTEMHSGGERALLYSPPIQQQNTHCYSFQYYMEGDISSPMAGQLNVYVLVGSNNLLENPVWSSNTSSGVSGWQDVQLALVPKSYKVVFEAFVYESSPGLMAIDNIKVSMEACSRAPHFLRLGDKEVNVGQNLTMQCLLYGFHMAAEQPNSSLPKTEVILQSTRDASIYTSKERKVYNDHLGVNFRFNKLAQDKEDKYRCVARNHSEVGISNYATVTVKVPPVPTFPPEVVEAGPTFLKLNLNTKVYVGDGPIVQEILSYRPTDGSWAATFDVHRINSEEYTLWHLQPDTNYQISIKLVRPGPGGTGLSGHTLTTTTKCGVPSRAVQDVKLSPNGSTSLDVTWKKPDFTVTQCHFYQYVVKYRKHATDDNMNAVKYNFLDTEDNFLTINGLEKYTIYDVKVTLKNSAGAVETGEYTALTGQDVPGPVGHFAVIFANETAITLSWDEPEVKNGDIEKYEVLFRGISSYQPDPPKTDTGLFEVSSVERTATLDKLYPGTNYSIGIRASTARGYGEVVEISTETKIAPPTMPVYPSPSKSNNTSTPTTIEITLLPAETNGAPITHYYVVVAEVPSSSAPEDVAEEPKNEGKKSRKGKRRKGKKRNRRQAEATSDACYAQPISFEDAKKNNQTYYFGAQFEPTDITDETKYLVGGGTSVGGFTNPPLDPNKEYKIFVRADSIVDGQVASSCTLVAVKEKAAAVPVTSTPAPLATESPITDEPKASDYDYGNNVVQPDADEPSTDTPSGHTVVFEDPNSDKSQDKDPVVFYASVGGGVLIFLVLLIIVIIIILRLRRKKMVSKRTDEVVNPFEVRMMMTDVNNDSGHNTLKSQDRQHLMPDVVAYDQHADFTDKGNSDQTPLMGDFSGGRSNEAPQNCAVRVDDFHIHVSQMRQSNNYGFSEEFATFREGPTNTWEIGMREENRTKNRYNNVKAYDHSRVILERVNSIDEYESDYINANYINGYKNPSMYIATQAPTPDTLTDFWSMVWQEKTPVIVMVSNLVEVGKVKCHKYWPDEHEQYGMIRVSQSDEEVLSDYTVRTFVLQQADGYDALEVKQFHFTSWPDHGAPTHPTNLLAFIRKVKSYEPAGEGPTLVHCSAGAGRTGCYIVIDMMLDMARDEGIVDIYNTVTDLRTRRVDMVQTEEQYIFIHSAVLEALLCGITSVAANELRQHYDELITVDPQTQIAPVQEEFETLNLMTPKLLETECSVARLPKNKAKNRFMDVLPADRHLAYLVTPDPQDAESNYINAVFADSYFLKNAFLVTQMPLPSTVLDMWRLIYDYNCTSLVMMNDVSEHDQTCSQYWPDNGVVAFGPFTVELLSKEDEVDVVTRIFKLQNVNRPSEGYRIVQQFQLCNWPASQPVPYSRNAMLRVIQLVNKWQEECAKSVMGRVLVHCVAGAGRSGTFVACHNMCSQLKNEYAVDVFNIVQRLRNVRPQLVETLEQYRFCYEVGWDFAEQ